VKLKLKVFVFLLQLKSPMQIMMGVDAAQQAELEMMIRELEAENRYICLEKFIPCLL